MELVHVVLREIGDFEVRDDRFLVSPYHHAVPNKPAASLECGALLYSMIQDCPALNLRLLGAYADPEGGRSKAVRQYAL